MAEPTLADLHVSQPLTDFSAAAFNADDSYVWNRVAPLRPVPKQSDKYFVWTASDFFRTDAKKRAPHTESAGRDFKLSDSSYYADVYAIHYDISEQQLAQADAGIDLEETVARGLAQDLNIRAELDCATALLNTASVWTTDKSVTTQWNDAASDIFGDIATGLKTVAKAIGRRPNILYMGADVWYDGFMNNPDILARLADNAPRIISREFVAGLLELDAVLVTQAAYNSADEGATASQGFIGGKHALLAYVDPNPGLLSPTAALSFNWTGLVGAAPNGIRTKRMIIPHLDAYPRIESDTALDFKAVAADAGYRFASVVA